MRIERLSCCSISFLKQSRSDAMRHIAAAGFQKVDLIARAPHLSLDFDEVSPDSIEADARASGLKIANLGTYCGQKFVSESAWEREEEFKALVRAIDLAARFGARSIRVMPGDNDPAKIDYLAEWFRRGAEHAASRQVYMGIENHGQRISGDPQRCRELAEKVGSPWFGVLYEPGNLHHAGVDYKRALETMKDCIVHVHFKDYGQTDSGLQRVTLGTGEIDFPWCLRRLGEIGYDGDIALEHEIKTEDPALAIKGWLKTALAW
ncbi:MAG: L-ribulose-5-phosphate 3-epimerase UlaE [candidate division BRC1 bacterium ADurb.BinA364]|nr:MAG: L-ribulose-5-phosphate 3-epimerase UlaE [candidate division BRC1 bacterium ADurb.BinA364]